MEHLTPINLTDANAEVENNSGELTHTSRLLESANPSACWIRNVIKKRMKNNTIK